MSEIDTLRAELAFYKERCSHWFAVSRALNIRAQRADDEIARLRGLDEPTRHVWTFSVSVYGDRDHA